jgi:hypothetical protein
MTITIKTIITLIVKLNSFILIQRNFPEMFILKKKISISMLNGKQKKIKKT